MPLVINTNVASLNSQRQLMNSGNALDRATERLSSGQRVNSAKDDAAGLAGVDRAATGSILGGHDERHVRRAGGRIGRARLAAAGDGDKGHYIRGGTRIPIRSRARVK